MDTRAAAKFLGVSESALLKVAEKNLLGKQSLNKAGAPWDFDLGELRSVKEFMQWLGAALTDAARLRALNNELAVLQREPKLALVDSDMMGMQDKALTLARALRRSRNPKIRRSFKILRSKGSGGACVIIQLA